MEEADLEDYFSRGIGVRERGPHLLQTKILGFLRPRVFLLLTAVFLATSSIEFLLCGGRSVARVLLFISLCVFCCSVALSRPQRRPAQVDPTLVPEWLKGRRRRRKEDEPALL